VIRLVLILCSYAKDHGVNGVEVDVRMTADGHLVAFHDVFTFRTTGVHGIVARMTLEELQKLNAAYYFCNEQNITGISSMETVIYL